MGAEADATGPGTAGILAGYARARTELGELLAAATTEDLRRRSNGTFWTNEQLLFHMVFGYMIVQALVPLVRFFSRLPRPIGRGFAALLNAGTVLFDFVNYWGSRFAATYFDRNRMAAKFDRVLASLSRTLRAAPDARLHRGMAFPSRWDPFFKPHMTLAEVYAYPTQHFDFHRKQLSL